MWLLLGLLGVVVAGSVADLLLRPDAQDAGDADAPPESPAESDSASDMLTWATRAETPGPDAAPSPDSGPQEVYAPGPDTDPTHGRDWYVADAPFISTDAPEAPAAPPPEPGLLQIAGTQGGVLTGGTGDDTLLGAGSADQILGGGGNDWIYGGPGDDSLDGGPGNDTLLGGTGADTLVGSWGDDLLIGGPGHNLLMGGAGNDTLIGHVPGDTFGSFLNGGEGDDLIVLGGGDTASGGAGADTFVLGDWLLGRPASVTDFDPASDRLIVVHDAAVRTEPLIDLAPMASGVLLTLDGEPLAILTVPPDSDPAALRAAITVKGVKPSDALPLAAG